MIGPDEARAMLDDNPANRYLNEKRVKRLVGAMTRGEWRFNGETIKVATDGSLLDGQHRLGAVELSGSTLPFLVVRGLPPEVQETVDTGKARGAADMLAIRGFPHANTIASCSIAVWAYENHGTVVSRSLPDNNRPTAQQIMETVDRHPGLLDSAGAAKTAHSRIRMLAPSVFGSLHFLFDLTDPADAAGFFERLMDGTGLEPGMPVHTLRERLLRDLRVTPGLGRGLQPAAKAAFTVTAFNYYRAGEELHRLQFRAGGAKPDRFPLIDGCPLNPGSS